MAGPSGSRPVEGDNHSRRPPRTGSRASNSDSARQRRRSTDSWAGSLRAASEDFSVDHKQATNDDLAQWRRSSLVLNPNRRFRYAADLSTRPQRHMSIRELRLTMGAVERFKKGIRKSHEPSLLLARAEGFSTGSSQLQSLMESQEQTSLEKAGGLSSLSSSLNVNLETGIPGTEADVAARQRAFGVNKLPEKPRKTFLMFVWDASQDLTLIVLAVCAVLSLVVGLPTEGFAEGWYDGAGILLSILLVVLVTATSDYRQAQQFLELDKEKERVFIQTVRGSVRQKVSVFDLVVGDVLFLSVGDIIPADGLFIDGHSLMVDESSMTGESLPVYKSSDSPFLLAGTKVQDGNARMLITGVGLHTEWGQLMAKITDSGDDETPLQVKLSGVATFIGRLGLYVAILVFVILMGQMLLRLGGLQNWGMEQTLQTVKNFAVAVTIIVVAVPEGLPLAVTLSLAYAMKKMMADKALVRKLAACETMGSATTICSDKTGTLTANQMTVVRAWMGGRVVAVTPGGSSEESLPMSPVLRSLLFESIFINTNGDVQEAGNVSRDLAASSSFSAGKAPAAPEAGGRVILGTPTETAFLSFAMDLGGSFRDTQQSVTTLHMDPFNSKRKRMGAAVQAKEEGGGVRVHWKGAGEIVLGMCSHVMGPDGTVAPISQVGLGSVISSFASDALRTLCVAYKDLSPSDLPKELASGQPWPETFPLPDSGLTLIAIVGIKDPLRPTVPRSVALCKTAGIKVRMVTGDNLETAMAIARECGILTEGGIAIEGPKFRNLNPEEMRALVPNLQVMARSSPTDKHTLVRELKAMGEVVAVTGDGTNDAPALKEADIGLAMGIAGTEVAKESADVIVLDDNFASVVNVAKWGRSVYTNIQKFVQFQLTVNIVALTTNFVSACVTGTAPLTAVQLLWVNLIMDTLGALALATEPPNEELMLMPPVGRKGQFITPVMWRNIIGQAVFQLIVLNIMQFEGKEIFGFNGPNADLLNNTMIFNTFVFCQLFNEINSRDMQRINVLDGIHRNPLFLSILTLTASFQIVLVQILGKFASTTPLTLSQFLLCVAIGSATLPLAALVKLIPVACTSGSSVIHLLNLGDSRPVTSNGAAVVASNGVQEDLHTPLLTEEGKGSSTTRDNSSV